jgi:hypothetical protein
LVAGRLGDQGRFTGTGERSICQRRRVTFEEDFPVPDGPRMAVILPFGTSKVMSSSTEWEPKDLVTPRSEMIGSPGAIQACPAVSCESSI